MCNEIRVNIYTAIGTFIYRVRATFLIPLYFQYNRRKSYVDLRSVITENSHSVPSIFISLYVTFVLVSFM